MSSVLADFRGRFDIESEALDGPVEGRVLLGKGQLILAAGDDEKVTIPLDSVVDLNTGSVPQVFDPLPGTPVTVAFEAAGEHSVALVAADEDTIRKFTTVLFKAVLNGSVASIKHPEKLGGRVLESTFQGGILSLKSGAVVFDTEEGPVSISLDAVVDFNRESRTIDGHDQPAVVVSHIQNNDAMTTVAATDSTRKLSILGRYLRREYRQLMASLENITLSKPETETLATIYSAGDMGVSLSSVLDAKPTTVKQILHSLHEKGLIRSGEDGPVLTSRGQVVVNQYLERVNE
jgi:helix-turn-helix protein